MFAIVVRIAMIVAGLPVAGFATAADVVTGALPGASEKRADAPWSSGVATGPNGLIIDSRAASITPLAPTDLSTKDASAKSIVNPSALSGLWFNTSQDGHGIGVTFSTSGGVTTVALTWYVYRNGVQVWMVGAGTLQGNRVSIPVVITTGAQFPPAFRATDVARTNWGTVNLNVQSCSSMDMSWAPTLSGYSAGSVNLVPLIVAGGLPCQVTPDSGGANDDHGNTCATATTVGIPGSGSGTINPASDRDFFRFTLGSSASVTLRSANTNGLDPIGTLYDGSCNALAESDDDAGAGGVNFSITRSLAAGTYFVGVRSFSDASVGGYALTLASTATPPPTTTVTVVFNNRLVLPLNVRANGSSLGQVAGAASITRTISAGSTLSVDFDMARAATNQGVAIGDAVSGFFNPISAPSGTITFNVENLIGTTYYFYPILTNQSGVGLLMGVNMGLQAENRCNCVVPIGSTGTGLGYYRLFSNSNVRAYRDGTQYSGRYVYWGVDAAGTTQPLPSLAEARTGVVRLLANGAP